MSKLEPFPCTACGLCCKKVHLSEQTSWLNRGDGVCRYFDEQTNLCTIYEQRPLVCRVEEYYLQHLTQHYSWQEFVRINLEVCQRFQSECDVD